jgi:hypothetical protein
VLGRRQWLLGLREVVVDVVALIGTNASPWEEQVDLGETPEAQNVNGSSQDGTERSSPSLCVKVSLWGTAFIYHD